MRSPLTCRTRSRGPRRSAAGGRRCLAPPPSRRRSRPGRRSRGWRRAWPPNGLDHVDGLHDRRPPGHGVLGDDDPVARQERAGQPPRDAVVLGLLADAEERSGRSRVAATAAMPNATGSAPIVSPPIAVASAGMTSSAASATSRIPSGRHAVCLVSRNHVLRCPDLSVNSPRCTLCSSTWRRRASRSIVPTVPGGSSRRAGRARRPPPSLRCRHAAPHLHRTPAGRLLRRPPGRRPGRRAPRLRRLLPLRPLPRRWATRTACPGPTDAWITLAGLARETSRIRLGTLVTSATFRLPGPLAVTRGPGRPDERRAGRARPGRRAGTRPSTRPTPSRSRRSASASNASRSSWRSSPGCGPPRSASGSPSPAATTRSRTPRASRSRCSSPARRSSSAATARRARPASPPATRPSSTWPSRPLEEFDEQCGRVRAACEAIDRDPSSLVCSAALVLCCGADEAEFRRRAAAIGRATGRAARARRRRSGAGGGRHPRPVAAGRRRARSTCRCSTCPTSSTSSWSPRRWRASCPADTPWPRPR